MPQALDHQKLELELFDYLNSPDTDKHRLLEAVHRCRQNSPERRKKSEATLSDADAQAMAFKFMKVMSVSLALFVEHSDFFWGDGAKESNTSFANRKMQFLANSLPTVVMLLRRGALNGE